MTSRLLVVTFTLLASAAFGQRRGSYWSLGGFGNVLYPGTGHAPSTPVGGVTGPYYFTNGHKHPGWWAGGASIPSEPVPDPAGSPGYGSEQSGNGPITHSGDDPQTTPGVIDHEFVVGENNSQHEVESDSTHGVQPDEPSGCESPPNKAGSKHRRLCSGEPTIYLLALKDGSIVQSLGYWLRDSILYYVSTEYALNQISLSLIDEQSTQRLNATQGVEFNLSAAK